MRTLVTGASGYVGGRLVRRLLEAGHEVACVARDPAHLTGRGWRVAGAQLHRGDALLPGSLSPAMTGVDVAFYLIHSASAGASAEHRDRRAADHFARSARAAGVGRIIYLGCLGGMEGTRSRFVASRHEVGDILRASGVPVTEFRSAPIVGSGSVLFEMIRYLTEQFPVVFGPAWMTTRCQPISVTNVLDYLALAVSEPRSADRILEIGGADVLTYGDMMRDYAAERHLRRRVVRLPVITPRLWSVILHLLTPVPALSARPVVEAMRWEALVHDDSAQMLFGVRLIPYREAVRRALDRIVSGEVETFWSGARAASEPGVSLMSSEGMLVEERRVECAARPATVFATFSGIGGQRGWFYADWGWKLRGTLDRIVGGVGLRRGRRDPDDLRLGDALDFWRVEALEPSRLIRLRAEMKLPGRGWLQFQSKPTAAGGTLLVVTAFFEPHGLFGFLYWYLMYPFHRPFFSGLAREVVRRSEESPEDSTRTSARS